MLTGIVEMMVRGGSQTLTRLMAMEFEWWDFKARFRKRTRDSFVRK